MSENKFIKFFNREKTTLLQWSSHVTGMNNGYDELMKFTNDDFEACHSFIQILFPLPGKNASGHAETQIAEPEIIEMINEFKTSKSFRQNYFNALVRFFKFWGITLNIARDNPSYDMKDMYKVFKNGDYTNVCYVKSGSGWISQLTHRSHNFLRLSRVFACFRFFKLYNCQVYLWRGMFKEAVTHGDDALAKSLVEYSYPRLVYTYIPQTVDERKVFLKHLALVAKLHKKNPTDDNEPTKISRINHTAQNVAVHYDFYMKFHTYKDDSLEPQSFYSSDIEVTYDIARDP